MVREVKRWCVVYRTGYTFPVDKLYIASKLTEKTAKKMAAEMGEGYCAQIDPRR